MTSAPQSDLDQPRRDETVWVAHRLLTPNFGDRLLGKGMATAVEALGFRAIQVEFTGNRDAFISRVVCAILDRCRLHALSAVVGLVPYLPRALRERPSTIILGGGQLLLPNRRFLGSLRAWRIFAAIVRTDIAILSVGTERKDGEFPRWAKESLSAVLSSANAVFLRDAHSQRMLRGLMGVTYDLMPDAAYGLDVTEWKASNRDGIFVCPAAMGSVAPYGLFSERSDYYAEFDRLVTAAKVESERMVVFTTTSADLDEAAQLATYLQAQHPSWHVDLASVGSEEELLTTLGGARAVVGARMHSVILGHILGVESFALTRNEKMRSYLDEALKRTPEEWRDEVIGVLEGALRRG